jgi:hypothetical protein
MGKDKSIKKNMYQQGESLQCHTDKLSSQIKDYHLH